MSLGLLSYAGYRPADTGPPVRHQHPHGLSRRGFLTAAGAAGGLAVASQWLWPDMASAAPTRSATRRRSATPRPVPETLSGAADFGDPTNTHVYHILPPMPPQNGQYIEPITITDFKGASGRTEVTGTGRGTPTKASPTGAYNFDVDMAFMQGVFIGVDGRRHETTFGFV
jgi:hypothetical protein